LADALAQRVAPHAPLALGAVPPGDAALELLAPDGLCVLFGRSGRDDSTINVPQFFLNGGSTLYGFIIFHEVKRYPASEGLARLARLVAEDALRPRIAVEAPWTDVADVAQWLRNEAIENHTRDAAATGGDTAPSA